MIGWTHHTREFNHFFDQGEKKKMSHAEVSGRRKAPILPPSGPLRHTADIALIVVGSFVIALGFNLFFLPHGIASGGVSGISVLFEAWFGLE